MAQRATSLGPNPSYFICFCFFVVVFFVFWFFCFLVVASARKNCFPPKKGIFVYFVCVSLCCSLALFHFLLSLSLSLFLFLCLCLVIFLFPSFCFSFLFLVLAFPFCFVCFLRVKLFSGFCCSACCLALF